MTTLQNELLQEILVEQYSEELYLLKEYLIEDIDASVKYLQEEILECAVYVDGEYRHKHIDTTSEAIREFTQFKDKVLHNVLDIEFEDLRKYNLIHAKSRINSFKEYLAHKESLKESDSHNSELEHFEDLLEKTVEAVTAIFNVKKVNNTLVDDMRKIYKEAGNLF